MKDKPLYVYPLHLRVCVPNGCVPNASVNNTNAQQSVSVSGTVSKGGCVGLVGSVVGELGSKRERSESHGFDDGMGPPVSQRRRMFGGVFNNCTFTFKCT